MTDRIEIRTHAALGIANLVLGLLCASQGIVLAVVFSMFGAGWSFAIVWKNT
jgi:hypothetical protein